MYKDEISTDEQNEIKRNCDQLLLIDNKIKELKKEKKILNDSNKMNELDIIKYMEDEKLQVIQYKDGIEFKLNTIKKKTPMSKKFREIKLLEFYNGNKERADLHLKYLYDKQNRYIGTKQDLKINKNKSLEY